MVVVVGILLDRDPCGNCQPSFFELRRPNADLLNRPEGRRLRIGAPDFVFRHEGQVAGRPVSLPSGPVVVGWDGYRCCAGQHLTRPFFSVGNRILCHGAHSARQRPNGEAASRRNTCARDRRGPRATPAAQATVVAADPSTGGVGSGAVFTGYDPGLMRRHSEAPSDRARATAVCPFEQPQSGTRAPRWPVQSPLSMSVGPRWQAATRHPAYSL